MGIFLWPDEADVQELEPVSGFRTLCHHLSLCQNNCTCNITLSFLKCDRSPFPSIPGLLLKYHPEDSGMTFWESTVILQLFCYVCLRRSNTLSGLTSASPSHLIWLNCSGKCYSGLWVCPYLPILYSKH